MIYLLVNVLKKNSRPSLSEQRNFFIVNRYVKSRSDKQLRRGLEHTESSCSPIERSNGLPIVPCGLIAWSLFNDTYGFTRGSKEIMVDRKNISWRSDREHKFGKDVYPFNFQNGSLIGGGKLDPNVPVSTSVSQVVFFVTIISSFVGCPFNNQSSVYHKKISF
jgi:hypothetical protein